MLLIVKMVVVSLTLYAVWAVPVYMYVDTQLWRTILAMFGAFLLGWYTGKLGCYLVLRYWR